MTDTKRDWADKEARIVLGSMADMLLVGDVAAALRAERAATVKRCAEIASQPTPDGKLIRIGRENAAQDIREAFPDAPQARRYGTG